MEVSKANYGSKQKDRDPPMQDLSVKDKRYLQSIERSLQTFDSLNEWADYIAFLSRLQKSLQLDINSKIATIPYDIEISNKLSLCLTPTLPNGVHQKALSMYDLIFTCLTVESLNKTLKIWLPGLLPVLSFGSIQVKSQIIKIFNNLLKIIDIKLLHIVTKPLILSFLSGLDDENSESFNDIFKLMDSLKLKLSNDHIFWSNFFLAIISNPERRIGGLYWCNKRLPSFITIKTDNGGIAFSKEAEACLKPNPGLLIRSFATALNTETVFNSANDIIIIRGFFDLMLSHLPLNSEIFNLSHKDKKLLMHSCVKVLLKKDMSLNRRLWSWLLGPDTDHHQTTSTLPINTSSSSQHQEMDERSEYFKTFGLDTLSEVLLDLINHGSFDDKIDGFKMALSLVIDKWEISHLLIPRILTPVLKTCYKTSTANGLKFNELLNSGQAFFNGVESSYIWSNLISNLLDDGDLLFTQFVLVNFDFNDEEMKLIHVPLALLATLINRNSSGAWINILSLLTNLISPKAFDTVNENEYIEQPEFNEKEIMEKIKSFYELHEEESTPIFSKMQLTKLVYQFFKKNLIQEFSNPLNSGKICDLFNNLIYILPIENFHDKEILRLMLQQPSTNEDSNKSERDNNLLISFSISKLLIIFKKLSISETSKVIKIITNNLWISLTSSNPKFYQVESVKCLFEINNFLSKSYIEASISGLMLQSNNNERLKAFITLWSNSHSSEFDLVLNRPLQIILDDLNEDNLNSIGVKNFIKNIIISGHSNRLLKMITNPLLEFKFMNLEVEEIGIYDELSKFQYFLKIIINVINSNTKLLKETFNNEFAVMDNSSKLKIIKTNEWDISTYKSLIFYIIEKFLSLKINQDFLSKQNNNFLVDYYNCIHNCLELFNILITGNENDFNNKFHNLIENCNYFIQLPNALPFQIELIQTKYLQSIFQLLKLSEDSKINLNLLHIEDEGREPLLIKFFINGVQKANTPALLEEWMKLLTRSLYLFNESVFSVLSILNTAIISKIESYFNILNPKNATHEQDDDQIQSDIELSINALISGLEDLLSISHSYLLTSKIRNKSDLKNGGNSNDTSFLGNVIQGVFSIESPAVRTTEQNKLYSILLAFQDAINIGFKIWSWSDSKKIINRHSISNHSIGPLQPMNNLNNEESDLIGSDSINHLANKLKFRSKKLLESLMDLERQEIIENLIFIDNSINFNTSIKLLNVLDGGRSQITLPHIFSSIITRCYSNLLDDNKKSHLNVAIDEREISKFLIFYFKSIDNDTITDVWNITIQFFKDVVNHFNHFKILVPNFLKIITIISLKLSNSKIDGKKNKKELADMFIKLLTLSVSGKRILFSSADADEKEIKDKEKETKEGENSEDEESVTPSPVGFTDELIDSLTEIMGSVDEVIQDSDKVSSCVNLIIFNLITVQIKNKKIHEIPNKILLLMVELGQLNANKSWKVLINDLFNDGQFFNNLQMSKFEIWNKIISIWISIDNDKFNELINKISIQSTSGNLFSWNEKSEVEIKINAVKRLSILILTLPTDNFLNYLGEIFNKIESSLTNNCPVALRSEITILIRIIILKFNQLHLLPYWSFISQQLVSIFNNNLMGKPLKQLSFLNNDELDLILKGCKLLDQLLLLQNDEFNLNEWIFVKNNFDIGSSADIDNPGEHVITSIIDRISSSYDLTILKESPVSLSNNDNEKLIPLLKGVTSIHSIANLRTFFESLSYLNYERIYSLKPVDYQACEADIINDLL